MANEDLRAPVPRTSADARRDAGAMTSVMRAATIEPPRARVLRVALVASGRVVEERVMGAREPVLIGATERSTFVVPGSGPARRIFEYEGGTYRLNLPKGVSGRVATGGLVIDLSLSSGSIALDEGARGRVVLGDSALLFQFVAPRAPAQKAKLPLSTLGLASDIDWTTAIIAGLSFLVHFGAVGALYSDWADPVIDDEVAVQQLVLQVQTMPRVPVETQEKEAFAADGKAKVAEPTKKDGGIGGSKATGGGAGKKGGGGAGSMNDATASALSAQLRDLDVQMLAGLGGKGGGTDQVLRDGNVPTGLLDGIASANNGRGAGGVAGLHMGAGVSGGAVRPGGGGHGLAGIGDTRAGAPAGAGSAVHVAPPPGNVSVAPPDVQGSQVPNAGGVVARMTAGFRRCYNNGLRDENPAMQGSVRVTARVGPNGDVLSASPAGAAGLSGNVVACVVQRVASAHFDPPTNGGATLVIPISFRSQ